MEKKLRKSLWQRLVKAESEGRGLELSMMDVMRIMTEPTGIVVVELAKRDDDYDRWFMDDA